MLALFLQAGLPFSLIRHQNGALRKRYSNRKNLKTPVLRFSADGKLFENGGFGTQRQYDNINHDNDHVISLPEFSSNRNSDHYCVFKCLQRNVDRALAEWNTRRERVSDFRFFVKKELV